MKRNLTLNAGFALTLCAAVILASSANGDDVVKRKTRDRSNVGQLDKKAMGSNVRASKLIGMNIQNAQGESVGEVSDIVLDARSGRVRYMAVTYGGFLGLGNKMFAVPFEAFKTRQDPDDRDETILTLNVTEQQLNGAVGFDEDHWPNFADTKFTSELDKRYGVERRRRDRGVDVDVDRDGVKVDVDSKPRRDN